MGSKIDREERERDYGLFYHFPVNLEVILEFGLTRVWVKEMAHVRRMDKILFSAIVQLLMLNGTIRFSIIYFVIR